MADSFRIGSGDGKTPEISKKPIDSTILEKIDLMEPTTAFVAVQGLVIPTLNQLKKDFSYLTASLKPSDLPSPMQLAPTRESILLKLKSLDTQAAFMYLATVVIPFLQKKSAEILEKQGDTMKEVSHLFDKWNEIQDEVNQLAKEAKTIEKEGIFKDGKFNIDLIYDYTDKDGKKWKIVRIIDSNKALKKLFNAKKLIAQKVTEFKKLFRDVEKRLPNTSKSLLETLKELSDKLRLGDPTKDQEYNFYHFPDSNEVRFEIPIETVPDFKDNNNKDKMNEIINKYTKESFGLFIDRDQTRFKTYMDNIAQGVTALTSISNMMQQELQVATQYHNSLLGLQKTAYDAINKVIQVATKAPPA